MLPNNQKLIMKTTGKQVDIPYSAIGEKLLQCIFDALLYVFDDKIDNIEDEKFKGFFKDIVSISQDVHLQNDKRLCKILLTAYTNVQENAHENIQLKEEEKNCCIPSPLSILYQMLTVPDEPQSAAYGVLFCRSLLYETFKVFPKHPLHPNSYKSFCYENISQSLENIEGDSISETEKYPERLMLAHYLALKNIFYIRFKDADDVRKYLLSKKLTVSNIIFQKFSYFRFLPDISSLMNELSGIPIPIKGMDTIFQGGLKTKSNSNLVIRISGQPGSGKTSLALALAASMAPFGTTTYYLSLGEERTEDLENRLKSLVPEYLEKLSIYPKNLNSWFLSNNVSISKNQSIELSNLTKELDDTFSVLSEKQNKRDKNYFPSVCPLIIVIDSIRPFLKDNADFNMFIEKCRELQSLIILISPNDEQYHDNIDYMVDTVINLKQLGTDALDEKPVRIMQLSKTRYQVARQGAHLFHFSGKNGIDISPQLPSLVDKREIVSSRLPSEKVYTNFFNEYDYGKKQRIDILDEYAKKQGKNDFSADLPDLKIWDKSQILLHGYGSTGKAGLALALLLYPLMEIDKEKDIPNNKKILIISLLYPEEYYTNLKKRIEKKYKGINKNAQIKCHCFYSGHLSSEYFIGKILNELDKAILEGEPFTSILLDGLHNATLQFPKLQKNDMIWSTLYSLLTKYYLTIVTTYTNFIVENDKNKDDKPSNKGDKYLLKGGDILLDILFQSSDYSFTIWKSDKKDNKDKGLKRNIYKGEYVVTLQSAIRHKIGNDEHFIWDREDLLLKGNLPKLSSQQEIPFSYQDV